MKMAKASERDLRMALDLSQMLESFERGYFPLEEDSEECDPFDPDNAYNCKAAMEMILDKLREGVLYRVTFGMLVLLDPKNELVDPNLDYLEHHPDAKWAREQRGELIDALRELRAAHSAVYPAFAEGQHAQDAWASRKVCADNAAYGVLAKEAAYGLIRYLARGAFA